MLPFVYQSKGAVFLFIFCILLFWVFVWWMRMFNTKIMNNDGGDDGDEDGDRFADYANDSNG